MQLRVESWPALEKAVIMQAKAESLWLKQASYSHFDTGCIKDVISPHLAFFPHGFYCGRRRKCEEQLFLALKIKTKTTIAWKPVVDTCLLKVLKKLDKDTYYA